MYLYILSTVFIINKFTNNLVANSIFINWFYMTYTMTLAAEWRR